MSISIGTNRENRIRDIIIVFAVIVIFGVLLIVLNSLNMNKAANWVSLKAEIVDLVPRKAGTTTSYDVFVKYSYGGKEYPYQLLNTYEISMQIHKIIDIKVNPSEPTEIIYASVGFSNTLYIIGGCLIGIGVLVPSIWIPIKIHKKRIKNNCYK